MGFSPPLPTSQPVRSVHVRPLSLQHSGFSPNHGLRGAEPPSLTTFSAKWHSGCCPTTIQRGHDPPVQTCTRPVGAVSGGARRFCQPSEGQRCFGAPQCIPTAGHRTGPQPHGAPVTCRVLRGGSRGWFQRWGREDSDSSSRRGGETARSGVTECGRWVEGAGSRPVEMRKEEPHFCHPRSKTFARATACVHSMGGVCKSGPSAPSVPARGGAQPGELPGKTSQWYRPCRKGG